MSLKSSCSRDTSRRLRLISVAKFLSAALVVSLATMSDTMHHHRGFLKIEEDAVVARVWQHGSRAIFWGGILPNVFRMGSGKSGSRDASLLRSTRVADSSIPGGAQSLDGKAKKSCSPTLQNGW